MNILDDLSAQQKLDQGHSYESITMLADQCNAAWNDVSTRKFPDEYRTARSILFVAMGGSAYAARLIKRVYFHDLALPTDLVSDYTLPGYVNEETLIIAASYSGNTEETLSCINDAFRFDPKIIGISSGGELKEILDRHLKPVYTFVPEYNPSMQPRLGQGYMQMGQIAILHSLGYVSQDEKEIQSILAMLRQNDKRYAQRVRTNENQAKQLAQSMEPYIIGLIGAEFMEGAIHSIRNPFHETGKHFADYFIVPELNHHLMEGLLYPPGIKDSMMFVLIDSPLYSPVIKKRMDLTRSVIEQNGIKTMTVEMAAQTPLGQAFELIQLGGYLTFYLAMLHAVDPAKIPWVDYFKKELKGKG